VGQAFLTDFYELNMAASYLRQGMDGQATFSLYLRRLPSRRGFVVAAGLEDCLAYLEAFRFDVDDLDFLEARGFGPTTLEALAGLRFTGRVDAVPEGRILFADEPLLEVTAPIAEAQLVETFLLNQVTFQTTLTSKAARCRLAVDGRFELFEFGLRRTQGIEAGMAAARGAAMVGFTGTSNTEAARRFGVEPVGTMAHSYIEAFPREVDAFRSFARTAPSNAVFLVDTYDTLSGVAHAIEVIKEFGLKHHAGVRLDSGDLGSLAHVTQKLLVDAGLHDVRIVVSGSLDEDRLADLVREGAPVSAAGVGTRLGTSADAPYLDSAYKLVEYDGRPVAKLSTDKATSPGTKQIFRRDGLADQLGLRDDVVPGTEALLQPVMVDGRRQPPAEPAAETLAAARQRFEADLLQLPAEARRLAGATPPPFSITPRLARLTEEVQRRLRPGALP
jgi:nicotinate phosphoribosyltransferase